MITEVLGDELLEDVTAASSFKDDLEFQSIEFVALAEMVQDEYEDIDFVAWIEGMEEEQMFKPTVGDLTELEAIKEVFGDAVPPFSSTKSLTGHSLGATGVHEAIYALLMLEQDFIAASANVGNRDESIGDLPLVTERVDDANLTTVMSNSFGFGGTNGTLVFKRYEDPV